MNIDGRALAEEVYQELLTERHTLPRVPILGMLVGSNDPVIESFVRIKTRAAMKIGVEIIRVDLASDAATDDALATLQDLAARVDGVIVQLPLPEQFDTEMILLAIPHNRDVDGLNPSLSYGEQMVHAPVAEAIRYMLQKYELAVRGKKVVVVGNGRLVGAPVAHMLTECGAYVTTITREENRTSELTDADIVVLGAGDPGFVKPEVIKDGCIIFDAGTSEQSGKVVGDADPGCAEKCTLFTPVPGGIGPVAVAMIFKNLFTLITQDAK